MKTMLTGLAVALTIAGLGVPDARAHLEVTAGVQINAVADFYAPLAPGGVWLEVGSYGRCWHPAHVAVGWRPYCEGRWVWTDCGWYWESDEPWAWACYHYGGWVYDPVNGWLWVPGLEWAPAWVSWRVGDGYIGWAPLGPSGVFLSAGLAIGSPFVFVESGHFGERVRRSSVIVNNTTIINRTKVITNIRSETRSIGGSGSQRVMVNEGPGVAVVQKATGRTVQAVPIRQVASRTAVPSSVKQHGVVQGSRAATPAPHKQSGVVSDPGSPTPERRVPPTETKPQPAPNHPSAPPTRSWPAPQPKPTPPEHGKHGSPGFRPSEAPSPQPAPTHEPGPGSPPKAPHDKQHGHGREGR